jgi:hypothetical protein
MNDRMVFRLADANPVCIGVLSGLLASPPIRRPLPADSVKVAPQRSPLRPKPVRAIPHLRKGLMRNVLSCLMVTDKVPQKRVKSRLILPVERVKGLRVPFGDLGPRFPIVTQYASPPCYSGWRAK